MANTHPRPLWVRILRGTLWTALCTLAIGAGTILGWTGRSEVLQQITLQTIKRTPPSEIFHDDSITLLLLGCDEDRAYGGKTILKENARSDMMLVAKIDFKANRISGVSIPRDTLWQVPGYREQKINAYHAIGGKDLAQRAVEGLIGVPIDRVVVLNYKAFQDVVNIVGGVDVFIDKKLKYTDRRGGLFIDLKPGRQKLDGYDAMCFVRYRHGDSDFMRQKRQKDFLLAFRESLMKNKGSLPEVADKAVEMMGNEFSAMEVASLALFAQKVGGDNIRMGQIPVYDVPNYNLKVDRRNLDETLREFHLLDRRVSRLNEN